MYVQQDKRAKNACRWLATPCTTWRAAGLRCPTPCSTTNARSAHTGCKAWAAAAAAASGAMAPVAPAAAAPAAVVSGQLAERCGGAVWRRGSACISPSADADRQHQHERAVVHERYSSICGRRLHALHATMTHMAPHVCMQQAAARCRSDPSRVCRRGRHRCILPRMRLGQRHHHHAQYARPSRSVRRQRHARQ